MEGRLAGVLHQMRLERRLAEVQVAERAQVAQPGGALVREVLRRHGRTGNRLLPAGVRRVVRERLVEEHVHLPNRNEHGPGETMKQVFIISRQS